MIGSSKAIDLFTMLSPTYCDVSPTRKPPVDPDQRRFGLKVDIMATSIYILMAIASVPS